MAKRKKQTATAEVTQENTHAFEFASEIRLRETPVETERGGEGDTEPAPPPAFDEASSIWSDFDRSLTMSTLRLEDALHECTSGSTAAHVRQVLDDADALADALFCLWSQTRTQKPCWVKCLPRVYRWANEVVEQLEESLVVDSNDSSGVARAFHLLASYSTLFIQGLIEPGLREAVTEALGADADEEAERLRAVSERVGLLDWTITCAASERH